MVKSALLFKSLGSIRFVQCFLKTLEALLQKRLTTLEMSSHSDVFKVDAVKLNAAKIGTTYLAAGGKQMTQRLRL